MMEVRILLASFVQSMLISILILNILEKNQGLLVSYTVLYEASLTEIDAHTILRNIYVLSNFNRKAKDLFDFILEKFKLLAERLTKAIQEIIALQTVITTEHLQHLESLTRSTKEQFEKLVKIEDDFYSY